MKDYLSLQEDQCKKFLHYIAGHIFQFPSIDHQSPSFMIYQPHLKFPTCRILFQNSPAFTSALIISRYDILFFIHLHYTFIQNIQRREVSGSRFIGNLSFFEMDFFCFYTKQQGWCPVQCQIKNENISPNSLLTGCTISGVELNNNVINVNKI